MHYPTAPWLLQGYAYQTVHLIPIERVRSFIPNEFEIISVLPNYTLGGVYLSSYTAGSTLEYNELIVVPGLVKYLSHIGVWVSHIYVDNPHSVAGGREIWGLPKELAQFSWERGQHSSCTVRQGDRLLCTLRSGWQLPLWRQAIAGQALSTQESQVLVFSAKAAANFALVGAELTIPPSSPFASLELTTPKLTVSCDSLNLTVDGPIPVGHLSRVAVTQ